MGDSSARVYAFRLDLIHARVTELYMVGEALRLSSRSFCSYDLRKRIAECAATIENDFGGKIKEVFTVHDVDSVPFIRARSFHSMLGEEEIKAFIREGIAVRVLPYFKFYD